MARRQVRSVKFTDMNSPGVNDKFPVAVLAQTSRVVIRFLTRLKCSYILKRLNIFQLYFSILLIILIVIRINMYDVILF